jgi:hypothetical protein
MTDTYAHDLPADTTDPSAYWPPEDGYHPDTGDQTAVIADALYAVAAELRTANHLAYLAATQSNLSPNTLAPICRRLGFPQ